MAKLFRNLGLVSLCLLAVAAGSAQNPCSANQVMASPNGSSGYVSCRALVTADLPGGAGIPYPSGTGIATVVSGTSWGTSLAAAGSGAGVTTGPVSGTNAGDLVTFLGSNGQVTDPTTWAIDPSTGALHSVGTSDPTKFGFIPTTVAFLPAAASNANTMMFVSDGAGTPPTCTGGGSNYQIAISDGSAWRCH